MKNGRAAADEQRGCDEQRMKLQIRHVRGNTFYFDFPGLSIPFYKLDDHHLILLDSGYARHSKIIIEYLRTEGILVTAILHSHAHPDHINGDHWLYTEPYPEIFLSEKDYIWALAVREERESQKSGHDEYLKENNLQYLRELKGRFADFGSRDQIRVAGKVFRLIPSTGHCLEHLAIVTPDDVCYVGDELMYGRTLEFSKAPYTYCLTDDIASKKKLAAEQHYAYIAAHEGHFLQEELESVFQRNMDIYNHILSEVARLEEAEPSLEVLEATKKLLENIGIHKYADVVWVGNTIRQYFEYYYKYKRRSFQ